MDDAESVFDRVYRRRVATPSSEYEVAGYWVFVAGAVGLLVATVLLLVGSTFPRGWPPSESLHWIFWRVAGTLGFLAAGTLLSGLILWGPLTKQSLRLISVGGLFCTLGAVLFFFNYPRGWARGFSDIARLTVGVYGVGIVVLVLGAAVWPLATPRRVRNRR